jgi:ParB-like chromosome segregation protein Spo0J
MLACWTNTLASSPVPADNADELYRLQGGLVTIEACPETISELETHQGTQLLTIESLQPADSPRVGGIIQEHAEVLAESEDEFPAVLVQRNTMRVIDGMHRIYAAQLRGRTHIAARFVDVDDDAAFLLAVESNITHGLPLSLADRKAAATRIIQARPYWSDRAIAKASGLSWKTVGVLRSREQAPVGIGDKRIGRDGKLRPVSGTAGRRLARDVLAKNPKASLREIAKASGVSEATARDVRDRLRRGEDVLTPGQLRRIAGSHPEPPAPGAQRPQPLDTTRLRELEAGAESLLDKLKVDPSLKYSDAGRTLLRLLHARPSSLPTRQVIMALPSHCLGTMAQVSRQIARDWVDLATIIEERDLAETRPSEGIL